MQDAFLSERFHALPAAGGLDDQDVSLLRQVSALAVHRAFQSLSEGGPSALNQSEDSIVTELNPEVTRHARKHRYMEKRKPKK